MLLRPLPARQLLLLLLSDLKNRHSFISPLAKTSRCVGWSFFVVSLDFLQSVISIARAMLKDAPIVILDEATANVAPENEDRLQKGH